MTFIDPSVLNDLQVEGGQDEMRANRHGLIQAVKAGTPEAKKIIPQKYLDELTKMSGARSIQIPVITDGTAQLMAQPSFTIPSNLPDVENYTVIPYDVCSGYRVYPGLFENNTVEINKYVQAQSMRVLRAMADEKESVMATNFELYKTQTWGGTTEISQGDGTYTFNTTPDELEVSKNAQKETMFNYIHEGFMINKVEGNIRYITQPGGLAVQKAEMLKYGAGNEKNLQNLLQVSPEQLYISDSISLAASSTFNGYAIRDGELGIISNHPYDFRNGTVVGEKKWSISQMEMPFLQSRVNVFINREATNATNQLSVADSNGLMSHYEEIMFWDRFYVIFPYNSDRATRPQGIVKLRGLTTA